MNKNEHGHENSPKMSQADANISERFRRHRIVTTFDEVGDKERIESLAALAPR